MRNIMRSIRVASGTGDISRFAAGFVVTIGLLLVSSASVLSGGDNDCDDDDGTTCCTAAPVPCSPCAPKTPKGSSGCLKSFIAEGTAGTYWYDVWKSSTNCFGGVIDMVPHDSNPPECSSGSCAPGDLIPYFVLGATKRNRVQRVYCKKHAAPEQLPNPDYVTFSRNGFAKVQHMGDDYCFQLMTIITEYPEEPPRVRHFAVEVDETTGPSVRYRKAEWTKPEDETNFVHEIDVYFGPHEGTIVQYRATTFNAVTWR